MSFLVFNRAGDVPPEKVSTAREAERLWHYSFLSGFTPRIVEQESGTEYVMDYCELVPRTVVASRKPVGYVGSAATLSIRATVSEANVLD